MKIMENTNKKRVAIQGYSGCFHEQAARIFYGKYDGSTPESVECATFDDLYRSLDTGRADAAIMAIENTVSGGLLPNFELLRKYDVKIKGEVFLRIRQNLMALPGQTIEDIKEVRTHYMAINQINKDCVRDVCITARDTKHVRAVSFNFHTPYPDTKELALSREDKAACCAAITEMMQEGAPVFNLKSAFPYLIENRFPTPCHSCVVMENGKLSTCGRCVEVPGLCEQCGYFFVAEYTLLFRGNPCVLLEMLRTYLKYI